MTDIKNVSATKNNLGFDLDHTILMGSEHLSPIKIKSIRSKYRMTQAKFAELLDVKYVTYTKWEQGKRYPSSPAYSLLRIADQHPDVFLKNRREIIANILQYFKM